MSPARSVRLESEMGGLGCLPSRGLARQLRVALTAGKRRSLASEGLKAGCCCCRTVVSESKSLRAAW